MKLPTYPPLPVPVSAPATSSEPETAPAAAVPLDAYQTGLFFHLRSEIDKCEAALVKAKIEYSRFAADVAAQRGKLVRIENTDYRIMVRSDGGAYFRQR
jgi:hypothetical protein